MSRVAGGCAARGCVEVQTGWGRAARVCRRRAAVGKKVSSVRTTYGYDNPTNSSTVEPTSLMSLLSIPLAKSRYMGTGRDYMANPSSTFFINYYHFDLMAWNNMQFLVF